MIPLHLFFLSFKGPTSMGDMWEEGYASRELDVKKAELKMKKEELERRRKKLQTMKRSATKKINGQQSTENATNIDVGDDEINNSNNNNTEQQNLDLELLTEEQAIRSHLDKIKK